MIHIDKLSKSYGDKKALDAFSLDIKEAQIFGLLGVNGAGKTTLLSILNGLIQAQSGSVEICGFDLTKDIKEIQKISSIIPQNLAFYENLTVGENIDFFAKIQNASKHNIQKALEINSLHPLQKQKASTLSGGQKRRLNIAIGLLNDPKILYFDEPTVGIDPKSRNEILESIKNYKTMGITVVYTSHYMAEIEQICDEVAIMDKGKLIEQDSLENLLSNRVSDQVFIELIFSKDLHKIPFTFIDKTHIAIHASEVCKTLEILDQHKIAIKQIRYGASNLEKHFLDITGVDDV